MLHTDKVIIVEGKYDKARLSGIIDALIITTDGFGIFNSKEKQILIKKLAREKGIIILTDSDSAGFKIRNFIKNIATGQEIIHAYIPDIYGKETRKEAPSKEGKLGVEGIDNALLEQALFDCGLFSKKSNSEKRSEITVSDLFDVGLCGCENSMKKRHILLKNLQLPTRLTGKNFLNVINTFLTKEEFTIKVNELFTHNK